jgi:Ca-activated chloride channel family protein
MNGPQIEAKMPLAGGLLCLLKTCLPLALMLLFSLVPAASWGSVAGKARKGNREYHRENFEQALKHYRDAQLEDPESPPLHFNIGNALYKQQNWEEAMAEYRMTLSSQDSALAQRAHYNMGNSLYRQGNLPEAIEAYKKALRIDPTDMDAKYNLELAQRQLQENEQQSQQSQDQQQEQDQQEQQEQGEQQQQQRDQQQQQQEEQEEYQKPQGMDGEEERPQEQQAQEGQEEGQKSPQPERPGQMSPEEVAQLLNALKEQEKKTQEEYRRAQIPKSSKTEWDW